MPLTNCSMIVIDIDRTTLTDDYRLLPAVVESVKSTVRAGIEVIPATARSPAALQPVMHCLGLEGSAICFNGAWIGRIGKGNPISQKSCTLEPGTVRAVVTMAEKIGLNPCWFEEACWYALSSGSLVDRESLATGTSPVLVDDVLDFRRPIYKVLCLESPSHGISAEPLLKAFAGQADFVRSDRFLIEITCPGVSKKAAAAIHASDLGIFPDKVVAIGDSENDLELIQWAGTGIAMGNAVHEVKAAADWVTECNANAGVAVALDSLLAAPVTAWPGLERGR